MSFPTAQIDAVKQLLDSIDPTLAIVLCLLFVVGAFLPTIIAHFFNRENRKKIFLANLPAIISWVAWGTLVVAAFGRKTKKPDTSPDK